MDKTVIVIKGVEYRVKFTTGFWRRVKERYEVTEKNIETKIQEDFGTLAPKILLESIVGNEKPDILDIENETDRTLLDVFEAAIIEGMTVAERELVEIAKKRRTTALNKLVEDKAEDTQEKK